VSSEACIGLVEAVEEEQQSEEGQQQKVKLAQGPFMELPVVLRDIGSILGRHCGRRIAVNRGSGG